MLLTGSRAEKGLKFWRASLAWKGIEDHANGWNYEILIDELCGLRDQTTWVRLSVAASNMLEDVVNDRRMHPCEDENGGRIFHFGDSLPPIYVSAPANDEPISLVN